MRFMVLIKADKNSEAGVLPNREAAEGDGQLQRPAGQGGGDARRRGAAAELQRSAGAVLGRQTDGDLTAHSPKPRN